MTFYQDEKKRIGKGWQAIFFCFLTLYFLEIQSAVQWNASDSVHGKQPTEVSFVTTFFLYGCIFLPLYLCQKLFFIKERRETVWLISKYSTVPLTKKQLYTAKLCLLAGIMLLFYASCIALYFLVLVLNDYWLLNAAVLLDIGRGFGWLAALTALFCAATIFRGLHLEKNAVC